MVEVIERLSVLKRFETDCYSICFYLLKCEEAAVEAAQYTLSALMRMDSFFDVDSTEAVTILRKESVKAAIMTEMRRRKRSQERSGSQQRKSS